MSDSWNDFIAGWVSGVAGIIVGSPLDVLKARLQAPTITLPTTQHTAYSSNDSTGSAFGIRSSIEAPKLGSWATLRNIIQTEGVGSMFKGVLSPIVGLAGLNALLFASYGFVIRCFENRSGMIYVQQPFSPTLGQVYIAGCAAGTACFILSTPIELIKIQAQVTREAVSTYGVASQIYVRSGFRGFYQGGLITIIRDAPSYGLYFYIYEGMKRLLEVADNNCSSVASGSEYYPQNDSFQGTTNNSINACKLLLAGGMAGVVSWAAIYPIDVVKSRLQMQQQQIQQQKPQIRNWTKLPFTATNNLATTTTAVKTVQRQILLSAAKTASSTTSCNYNESAGIQADRPYASIRDCVMRSYRNEGLGVFFRGLWPTILRAFPVNAVTFYIYELTINLLNTR